MLGCAEMLMDAFESIGCTPVWPEGGFFLIVNCSPLDAVTFSESLHEQAKVTYGWIVILY